MIELKGIGFEYRDGKQKNIAIRDIDLSIDKGELLSITGPSGSGKSTLMKIIGGIIKPTAGEYLFDGRQVGELSYRQRSAFRNQHFGYILQNSATIPDRTVYQNVELPLIYAGMPRRRRTEVIEFTLSMLGILEKRNVMAGNLSGGQKQRVAIARAIVNSPEVVLADEPTGALDQANGQQVMDLLVSLWRKGKTVLLVTHNETLAQQCPRRVCLLDGRIEV